MSELTYGWTGELKTENCELKTTRDYSYLKASMGSSLEAFWAG